MKLSELKNTHRKKISIKRVGRGIGSGMGKTCGRGTKGDKARSGFKRRAGNEGGQLPVFRKIPIRGFSRGRFKKDQFALNVELLGLYFKDGDVVNMESLKAKRLISNKKKPILKVLGNGELKISLTVEVNSVSKLAEEKIVNAKGAVKIIK